MSCTCRWISGCLASSNMSQVMVCPVVSWPAKRMRSKFLGRKASKFEDASSNPRENTGFEDEKPLKTHDFH